MAGMDRRLRFSVASLLWMTFWVAMLFTLWQAIALWDDNPKPLGEHIRQMAIVSAVLFVTAGLAALNGRSKLGAAIGVLAAFFTASCMAPWIY